MPVNASDIQICLPFDEEALEPIAHLFNASLNITSSLIPVIKYDDNDSIWSNDIVDGLSYTLTGTSYLLIANGYSFDDLLDMQVNRTPVDIMFKIENEEYSGKVIINSIRLTGNTENNAQVTFSLKGQGKFEKSE